MSSPTVNFSDSDEGLFTPDEVRGLMRVEYDRAHRYRYPVSVLLVAIDRIEYLHDLYGRESKEEILQAVIRALRSTTRDSDFLGCLRDERILAIFPHAGPETVSAIATRLLRTCRELSFRSPGRTLRATLSIGAATTTGEDGIPFDRFVGAAEEAVAFALSNGGDRFVRRESAAAVIEDLRSELEEETERLREEQRRLAETVAAEREAERAGAPAAPANLPRIEDLPESRIGDLLRAVFRSHGRTADTLPLEEEVVRVAEEALSESRAAAVHHTLEEQRQHVDLLERRLEKLKDLLDTTEAELARVAALKGVDAGIASIYRTVQGLAEDDENKEAKKEMLSLIFEANLDLQKKGRT